MFIALPCAPALWSTRAAGHSAKTTGRVTPFRWERALGSFAERKGWGPRFTLSSRRSRCVRWRGLPRRASFSRAATAESWCAAVARERRKHGVERAFLLHARRGRGARGHCSSGGHATGRGFARSSSLTDARCSCWRRARVHRARCSWVTGPPGTESRSRISSQEAGLSHLGLLEASRRQPGFLQGGSRVATSCAEFAFC